jgi:hypothetical protein
MTKYLKTLMTVAVFAGSMASASAVTITTLYNTGVDANGVPLTEDAVDPHYVISSGPSGPQLAYTATSAQGWPVAPAGPWIGDDLFSAWATPSVSTDGEANALYTYTTTFDLTGLDPLSAVISGLWAADDAGGLSDIILNGVSLGQPNANGFSAWSSFVLNSGFQAGVNTLSFQVQNSGGGPSGVRVEMSGTANSVPEGGAGVGLLGIGLIGVETLRRRINKRRTV